MEQKKGSTLPSKGALVEVANSRNASQNEDSRSPETHDTKTDGNRREPGWTNHRSIFQMHRAQTTRQNEGVMVAGHSLGMITH